MPGKLNKLAIHKTSDDYMNDINEIMEELRKNACAEEGDVQAALVLSQRLTIACAGWFDACDVERRTAPEEVRGGECSFSSEQKLLRKEDKEDDDYDRYKDRDQAAGA